MSRISLLDNLLKKYKLFVLGQKKMIDKVKNNLLQNDKSSAVEEKIVSIAISSVLVWIITGILGLFGVYINFFLSVVFFAVGWIFSKFINNKVFGKPRVEEEFDNEEKLLLNSLDILYQRHYNIREKINTNNIVVNFTNYKELKKEFDTVYYRLSTFSCKNLGLKYKAKHRILVNEFKKMIDDFNYIYANKKRSILWELM